MGVWRTGAIYRGRGALTLGRPRSHVERGKSYTAGARIWHTVATPSRPGTGACGGWLPSVSDGALAGSLSSPRALALRWGNFGSPANERPTSLSGNGGPSSGWRVLEVRTDKGTDTA